MKRFYIFILRVILGAEFAMILIRMFYPQAQMIYTVELWGFLVGMAYVFEYFRAMKSRRIARKIMLKEQHTIETDHSWNSRAY